MKQRGLSAFEDIMQECVERYKGVEIKNVELKIKNGIEILGNKKSRTMPGFIFNSTFLIFNSF
jgi:hypothetical protein